MRFTKWRWPWLILMQALIVTILTALAVLLLSADAAGVAYGFMMWAAVPLAGAVTAFFAVRMGLVSFAAFWLPPVVQTAVHWLIAGYPPLSAGMPLTAAIASVISAAAGEEWNKRGGKRRKRKNK